jgi:hypothetical protein
MQSHGRKEKMGENRGEAALASKTQRKRHGKAITHKQL